MRGKEVSPDVPICSTKFLAKFGSWSWTCVNVVFMLIWCDVVQSLEFDPLILSRLDSFVWFEEAEHVMFLRLESWKKACIFKGASIFEGGRLQELRSLLALWRILFRPSGAKTFLPHKWRELLYLWSSLISFYGLGPDLVHGPYPLAQSLEFRSYLILG